MSVMMYYDSADVWYIDILKLSRRFADTVLTDKTLRTTVVGGALAGVGADAATSVSTG